MYQSIPPEQSPRNRDPIKFSEEKNSADFAKTDQMFQRSEEETLKVSIEV